MSRETMVWGAAAKSLVGQGIHEGEVYNNKQLIERRAEKLKCVLRRERGKKKQEYIQYRDLSKPQDLYVPEHIPSIVPSNVANRLEAHNQRRQSDRKPIGPHPAYIRENLPHTAQITKPDSSNRKFTPLKKTLLERLIRKRIKIQRTNDSRFHTARLVNGKKTRKYPVLRKELVHKRKRLDRRIAKEVTRLSLAATPLKEFIVVKGISIPLNINSSFDETLNKRIKQLRRILFLDEDQVEKSNDQVIAMDGLFALEDGKGLKFLAQLILGKENTDSGFMKRMVVFFANRNSGNTLTKFDNDKKFKNNALKISDVLELINLGQEQVLIAQVKDNRGMVIIQISYLKGDKLSIEIPGKYIKPADLEQAIDKWLKTYDAENY